MLPPAYFLLSIVAMLLLHFFVPLVRFIPLSWGLLGLAPLVAGIGLAVYADRLFAAHETTIHPYGTAAVLVEKGPFRFSRNPMYLGLALVLVGIAVFMGSLTPFLVIPVFVLILDKRFISFEERVLEERFGREYAEYKRRVRKWV